MAPIIRPTPGRVVWYYTAATAADPVPPAPLAAMVSVVWTDRCVNLSVLTRSGEWQPRTSVTLKQPGDLTPGGEYCAWMPYQVGQAVAAAQPVLVPQVERRVPTHQAFAQPFSVSQTDAGPIPGAAFDPVALLNPTPEVFASGAGGDFGGGGASASYGKAVSESASGADTSPSSVD